MMRSPSPLLISILCCFILPAEAEPPHEHVGVSYRLEIEPILQRNCVACHRSKQSEGGLSLETSQALLAGGESGSPVVANDPGSSLVYSLVSGKEDPIMPPDDNTVGAERLTEHELRLLGAWIAEGAIIDDDQAGSGDRWQPIPDSVRTTYALAVSPDDRTVAVGHANRVELRDAKTGAVTGTLADERLTQPGVADVDVVQAIAFSPLGDRIATGGFRTVRIWTRRGTAPAVSSAMQSATAAVTLSPDRSLLAITDAIGDVEVWDVASDTPRYRIASPGPVTDLAWHRQEALLIGYADGRIRVCDGGDGSLIREFDLEHSVARVEQGPEGRFLASLGTNGQVQLFEHHQAKPLKTLAAVSDATSILFLAANNLVIGTASGAAVMIDPVSDRVHHRVEHGATIRSLAADGPSRMLATGGADGKAKLWNVDDGNLIHILTGDLESQLQIAELDQNLARERATVEQLRAKTTKLQKHLEKETSALAKATEAREKALKELADKQTQRDDAFKQIGVIEQKIQAAKQAAADAAAQIEAETRALAKQRETLAAIEEETQKKTADLAERDQALVTATKTRDLAAEDLPRHHEKIVRRKHRLDFFRARRSRLTEAVDRSAPIVSLALLDQTSDELEGVVGIVDAVGTVRTFDASSGKPIDRFDAPEPPRWVAPPRAFFLDAQHLLVSHSSRPPHVVGLETQWQLEQTVGGRDSDLIADRVTAIDFRQDGACLAIGSGSPSREGQVLIVSTSGGEVLRRFDDLHSDTVLCVRFSPDQEMLATGSADKSIRLLDVRSQQVVGSLDGHTHHVLSLAWKQDGRQIASGSSDGTIKLWDIESGQRLRTIEGFSGEVTAIDFLGDSVRVVSGCGDGQIRVHDTGNGGLVAAASVAGDFLFTIGTTGDGSRVMAAGHNGTVNVWQIDGLKNVASWD